MDELKACPFCGGEPERVYKSSGQTTHIECTGCKAQFPKSTMSNRYDDAWNTRAERTCAKLPPLIEQTCIVRRGGCEMEFGYWRCSECQCENFEGARYCQYCGAKVVDA